MKARFSVRKISIILPTNLQKQFLNSANGSWHNSYRNNLVSFMVAAAFRPILLVAAAFRPILSSHYETRQVMCMQMNICVDGP